MKVTSSNLEELKVALLEKTAALDTASKAAKAANRRFDRLVHWRDDSGERSRRICPTLDRLEAQQAAPAAGMSRAERSENKAVTKPMSMK